MDLKYLNIQNFFQEIFEIVSSWICHDVDQRKQLAIDYIKRFKLGLLPTETLTKALEDGIEDITECRSDLEEVVALQTRSVAFDAPLPYIAHPEWFSKGGLKMVCFVTTVFSN